MENLMRNMKKGSKVTHARNSEYTGTVIQYMKGQRMSAIKWDHLNEVRNTDIQHLELTEV